MADITANPGANVERGYNERRRRQQTIDAFGKCLANQDGSNDWFKSLCFDDLEASIPRVDLTPAFVAPTLDSRYDSPQAASPIARVECVDETVVERNHDLRMRVTLHVHGRGSGHTARRIPTLDGDRLVAAGQHLPSWLAHARPAAVAVRAFEDHDRVRLRLVRLVHPHVRNAKHLVLAVAIQVHDVGRRRGPLQPLGPARVRPLTRVVVIVILLDLGVGPTDELPPGQARP
jgi:hypothetical protein